MVAPSLRSLLETVKVRCIPTKIEARRNSYQEQKSTTENYTIDMSFWAVTPGNTGLAQDGVVAVGSVHTKTRINCIYTSLHTSKRKDSIR